MQRKKDASEQRLQSKYSLGIGGHMRYEDLQEGPDLFSWAKREFEEEVAYEGTIEIAPLGVLNDDSNDVGKVHLGLVLMVIGDSDKIKVKSELASGTLMNLSECLDHVPKMETWSQMVLMTLLKEGIRFNEKPADQENEPCSE
jgi:predicted NUDIX family phosphoesterase